MTPDTIKLQQLAGNPFSGTEETRLETKGRVYLAVEKRREKSSVQQLEVPDLNCSVGRVLNSKTDKILVSFISV